MLSRFQTLVPYVNRYRWRYAGGIVALVFRGALATALPYLLGKAIDALSDGQQVLAQQFVVLLLVVAAAKGIAQYAMRWILITISRDIEYDLRNDLSAHLISLDGRFYQRYRTGDLMARSTNDLAQVRSLLGPGLMYSAEIGVVFLTVISVMAWTDWVLTLLVFLPMPFISFGVGHFGRRTHAQFQEVQSCFSVISMRVQEHIAGLRMLRAYGQSPDEERRFAQSNRDYLDASLGLVRIWRTFYPFLEFVVGIASVAVLGFGGWRVLQGEITLGTFTMFLYFLGMLTWPMIGMGVVVNITQRGVASLGRLEELLGQRPTISDGPETRQDDAPLRGGIEWRDVTVRYPNATVAALSGVCLRVPVGGSLAVIGPVGSGKSTLVNLVPRLLDPTDGKVYVDGVDVRRLPVLSLRRCVGFVPQETFLFSRSICDNIRLGTPEATGDAVREAARLAALLGETDNFPKGLETPVGERGITLSGGQKQRVAVARALVREPRVVILDDATSSLDAETENELLRHVRQSMRDRTVVIVTHRVSSARLADRIAVLDGGSVVDSGSHDELLERGGLYARMHDRQQLEEELASR